MSKVHIQTCGPTKIYWDNATEVISFTGDFTVLADGAPRAYGPAGCSPEPLDYLENAGYPGNWWGVVTDSKGNPIVQKEGAPEKWPYPSLYVSCTAYAHTQFPKEDCRRWVDAEHVLAAVVPGNVRLCVPPKFLGCRVKLTDKKNHAVIDNIVCADIGPSHHAGEGSMALAAAFGINNNPKNGGSSDRTRWYWEFFPGEAAKGYVLQ
jgi:hypothetical protein